MAETEMETPRAGATEAEVADRDQGPKPPVVAEARLAVRRCREPLAALRLAMGDY